MEKFATTAPITAVVDLPAGRVQVIAADRADATVEVLPAESGRGRDVRTAEQTAVAFQDGVLRINTVPGGRLTGAGAVEVTLQVPVGSRIEVTSESTELRAVGRLGDVVVEGAYRRIKIDEADSVRLTAVDGDVEVGGSTARPRSAPPGARSGSPRRCAVRWCSAPSPATSRWPRRPGSPRPWTPVPATAGSATACATTAPRSSTSAPPPPTATSPPGACDRPGCDRPGRAVPGAEGRAAGGTPPAPRRAGRVRTRPRPVRRPARAGRRRG